MSYFPLVTVMVTVAWFEFALNGTLGLRGHLPPATTYLNVSVPEKPGFAL